MKDMDGARYKGRGTIGKDQQSDPLTMIFIL